MNQSPRSRAPHERLLTLVRPLPTAAAGASRRPIVCGTSVPMGPFAPPEARRVPSSALVVAAAERPLHTSAVSSCISRTVPSGMQKHSGCGGEHVSRVEAEHDAEARRQWRAVGMAAVFIFAFSYQLTFVLQAVWR